MGPVIFMQATAGGVPVFLPDTWMQLGATAMLISFLAWLVRYFIDVVAKKDDRIQQQQEDGNERVRELTVQSAELVKEITDKADARYREMTAQFVESIDKHAHAITNFGARLKQLENTQNTMAQAQNTMAQALHELTGALRRGTRE